MSIVVIGLIVIVKLREQPFDFYGGGGGGVAGRFFEKSFQDRVLPEKNISIVCIVLYIKRRDRVSSEKISENIFQPSL